MSAPAHTDLWVRAWADEFNGPRGRLPNSRKWTLETGYGWGDGERQSYTRRPANVALDGKGHLAITARRERYTEPMGAPPTTRPHESTRARSSSSRTGGSRPGSGCLAGAACCPRSGRSSAISTSPAAAGGRDRHRRGLQQGAIHRPRHAARAAPGTHRLRARGNAPSKGMAGERLPRVRGHVVPRKNRLPARRCGVRGSDALRPSPGSTGASSTRSSCLFTLAVGPRWLEPPDGTTPWPATMLVDWVRVRFGRATFCPVVRTPKLRPRCPRRTHAHAAAGPETTR